jgi:VWFA-related protein
VPLLLSLLLLSALTLPAVAQDLPQFGETVEVRIANVDVVVTTRDGKRVQGLKQEDFELLEEGKPQPITNFYEMRSAAPVSPGDEAAADATTVAIPPRPRNVAIFIDVYSLDPIRRNEALGAVRRFVASSLTTRDQVMLALFTRRMTVPLTFTSDRARLETELQKLSRVSGGGLTRDKQIAEMQIRSLVQEAEVASSSRRGGGPAAAYGAAVTQASHFAEDQRKRTENLTIALQDLFRGMAGVEGKKVVLFVGESFPRHPGLGMYQFVNDAFERFSTQVRFVVPQIIASRISLVPLVERVARDATMHEIAFNAVYTGDDVGETPAESQGAGQATLRNFLEFNNTGGTLAALASETGGLALIGSRNFRYAADELIADLGNYYSLGYRVTSGDARRRIVVRTKNRALTVRARRTFVGKSVDQEIDDRVTGALYQSKETAPSPVRVTVGEPKRQRRDRIRVPIEVAFPSSLLTLVPQDGRQVGGFDIVVAASDNENRLAETHRQTQAISYAAGSVPPTIIFSFESLLRDRPGMIAIGVVDRLSKSVTYTRVSVR